ncbi:MAG TPA: hypothetical protein VNM16_04765 [Bacillota bacterium]|nr:hypothetical protein [Bacillota bacterium]
MGRDRLVGRLGLGVVFGGFGIWELTAPSEWAGYVPPFIGAHIPAVPLVLAHGWVLLLLGAALVIDFMPEVAVWVAVAMMGEIVTGLLVTSGFSDILLRDLGLLALALALALPPRRAPAAPSTRR